MKTSIGMYQIAKAICIRKKQILKNERHVAGYGMTLDDLKRIYARNGYNVSDEKNTVMARHLENWELGGMARVSGGIVFFYLDVKNLIEYQANQILLEALKNNPDFEFVQYMNDLETTAGAEEVLS